ncbi:MAG: hypothetical protein JWQ33_3169 [Ramlibacter sp.]|nr:hypothetical protein [Ramlibacter sp.]
MFFRCLLLSFVLSLVTACGGGGGGSDNSLPAVVSAPVITSQPASQTAASGQAVTFSVSVQDASGVSYQWLRNGAAIAGEVRASYTLPLAQTGDSGSTWSVVVANAGGTVTSNVATLTVAPAVVQVPLGVSLFAGNLASTAGNTDGAGPAAHFNRPAAITVDASGNAYVVDRENATLRKITPAGVVSTLAGAAQSNAIVDGTGANARFNHPDGMVLHTDGFLYVSDGTAAVLPNQPVAVIRRVSLAGEVTTLQPGLPAGIAASGKDGLLYLVAGYAIYKYSPGGTPVLLAGSTGVTGYADGVGANARFGPIAGLAVDAQSVVYVGDPENRVVRKISPGGEVTTLAGVFRGLGFADGDGAAARFNSPQYPALDAAGNIWVGDGYVLRRITPTGTVTTPYGGGHTANSLNFFSSLAIHPVGNVLFTAGDGVGKVDTAGNTSNLAGDYVTATGTPAPVTGVSSLAVDRDGVVYAFGTTTKYLPSGAPVQRALLPGETPATVGPVPSQHSAVVLERDGSFLVASIVFKSLGSINAYAPDGGTIERISPTGTRTVLGSWSFTSPVPYTPASIAIDAGGTIYFTDLNGKALRKLAPDGTVTTIGLAPVSFTFASVSPAGLAVSPAGTLYMTGGNAIRKLDAQGNLVLVAGSPDSPGAIDGAGNQARFVDPTSPAFDAAGNLYVADGNTVRKITPEGVVTTIAGQVQARGNTTGALPASFGGITGLAVAPDGLIYVAAERALLRIRVQ